MKHLRLSRSGRGLLIVLGVWTLLFLVWQASPVNATIIATNDAHSTSPARPSLADVPITGLSANNNSPTSLGNTTNLTATISTGSNVTYQWNYGDGSPLGSGATTSHTYANVGNYTAIVTATNGAGSSSATTLVTINNVPISGLSATNDSPMALGRTTHLTATVSAGTGVTYTWDFGDGTPTTNGATASHIYASAGNYTAVVTASQTSLLGNAIQLDGVNDYITAPLNGTALSQFTIEMWVKDLSGTGGAFSWANSLDAGTPMILFSDDGFLFYFYFDNDYRCAIFTPTQWTHVALTYNAGTWRCYTNGALFNSYAGGNANQANATALIFGNGFGGFWHGQIDDARIWSVERTQSQIQANMNNELNGNESGLLAYYRFNDASGSSSAANSVSGGSAGTLNNMNTTSAWITGIATTLTRVATTSVSIQYPTLFLPLILR